MSGTRPAVRSGAARGVRVFLSLSVLTFAIGAIVVQAQGVPAALKASLWGLVAVSLLWVGAALLWNRINAGGGSEPALAPLLRDGANVVITVDGIVLGLIYAFVAGHDPASLAVRTGSVSLAVGAVLALTLYSLAAGNITTAAAVALSTSIYSLAAWATAFGLLCMVFTLVYPG